MPNRLVFAFCISSYRGVYVQGEMAGRLGSMLLDAKLADAKGGEGRRREAAGRWVGEGGGSARDQRCRRYLSLRSWALGFLVSRPWRKKQGRGKGGPPAYPWFVVAYSRQRSARTSEREPFSNRPPPAYTPYGQVIIRSPLEPKPSGDSSSPSRFGPARR